jgi:ABC-2 type transport system permease protein
MRHFFTILSHEVRMLLVNASTYVAAVLFLAVMGFIFADLLDGYSREPQAISPAVEFFRLFPVPVLFMVPLLTMRCFAEERRLGTIETLLTTPVTTAEVVLGKFAAAYLLYLALWASTGGFFYILFRFAGDARFVDPGPLLGGYCFIAISGLLFIAIGVFASSLTRSQAVAGIIAFVLLFALILGFHWVAQFSALRADGLSALRGFISSAQVLDHFDDFCRGIIDSRQVIFYLSGTSLALIFSMIGVEAKLLHS